MRASAVQVAVEASPAGGTAHAALARLLDELASVLVQVPPSVYVARLLPGVSGSIGEHVRHILDHVTALVGASAHTVLTYDRRERGTAVEVDNGAALQSIMRLKAMLYRTPDDLLDSGVTVSAVVGRGERPMLMRSTPRRELAFVLSHTLHHQALIAVLLAIAGEHVPRAFGVAPSTPLRQD